MLDEFIHEPRIAYFSMGIALCNEIPTYSGGLGVLAGDTLRSAADLELPMVAVTLVSRRGYFRQEIDTTGRQIEQPNTWEQEQGAKLQGPGWLDQGHEGRDRQECRFLQQPSHDAALCHRGLYPLTGETRRHAWITQLHW